MHILLVVWLTELCVALLRDFSIPRQTTDQVVRSNLHGRALKAMHLMVTLVGSCAAAWAPLQLSWNAFSFCEKFLHIPPPSFARDVRAVLLCSAPFLILLVLAAIVPARRPGRWPTFVLDLLAASSVVGIAASNYRYGSADCAMDDDNGLALVVFVIAMIWPWAVLSALSKIGAWLVVQLRPRFA